MPVESSCCLLPELFLVVGDLGSAAAALVVERIDVSPGAVVDGEPGPTVDATDFRGGISLYTRELSMCDGSR